MFIFIFLPCFWLKSPFSFSVKSWRKYEIFSFRENHIKLFFAKKGVRSISIFKYQNDFTGSAEDRPKSIHSPMGGGHPHFTTSFLYTKQTRIWKLQISYLNNSFDTFVTIQYSSCHFWKKVKSLWPVSMHLRYIRLVC